MDTVARNSLLEREFQLADDLIYLNHAALGPWPQRTVETVQRFAAQNGVDGPRHWSTWYQGEQRLRDRIARLIDAPDAAQVTLMGNTSQGLSLLARGLSWRPGDQVLTLAEEFSSNRWPWEQLTPQDVALQQIKRPPGQPVHEALIAALGPKTRLVAVSSVQYVTGELADLEALVDACRRRGVLLVVDAIQSAGAIHLPLASLGVDAVATGSHKWLLAPEGVGFLWLGPALADQLTGSQAGWRMAPEPFRFAKEIDQPAAGGRRFEPGTLNTLGLLALDASLSLYEELGPGWVTARVQELTAQLIEGARRLGIGVATPADAAQRGGIVALDDGDPDVNRQLFKALSEHGVMAANRGGLLRVSPHYHTRAAQIDQFLEALAECR
ncbi:MAG: aminotransferase class V-fold PLP-dependent enzyme [Pseudomonadota bacterium]